MTTYTQPTPEENEAFEVLSRKQEAQVKTYGEMWLWLPAGEYTETQLREIVNGFDRMREHHKKAMQF